VKSIPNPFSYATEIKYYLSHNAKHIELKIYDITGRLVRQWDTETGRQRDQIIWDGKDSRDKLLPSGIYFCELKVDEQRLIEKLILSR